MSIFQPMLLQQQTDFQKEKIDPAHDIYRKFFMNTEVQENFRTGNEEHSKGEFLRQLFGEVLGYKIFPAQNFNLKPEQKNETDAKKADAAIEVNGAVRAVVEIKGVKTGNLKSFEDQAFRYKNNHENAAYVITSNFEKLRFYIGYVGAYKEWNLFTLAREEFGKLWVGSASQCC